MADDKSVQSIDRAIELWQLKKKAEALRIYPTLSDFTRVPHTAL